MKITIQTVLMALFMLYNVPLIAKSYPTSPSVSEFEMLMRKIRQDFAKNPKSELIEEALQMYDASNGSFKDVDYSSIQRTKWPPMTHLERMSDFAFAYTNPQNKYYQNSSLFEKIEKGLEFWHQRDPWCHNWWYNQIAEPQCLGILLIQMRIGAEHLPAELEKKLLERIKKDGGDPAKWTGANRTDIALHWIYRSCLTRNEADLETALENAYSPLVYTTKEGFQHDNSYFQHGVQLYIGGYGDEILKGITQIATYTKGTQYAIPEDKMTLLSKFMRETYYATIRGQYMLFDVLGRGVSRPGVTKKTQTALFAQRMIELDPKHADEFKSIIERLKGKQTAEYALKAKHTHYFRGDYTLHIRPQYTFDVRLVSTRTMRCEYGNEENLKTYFMSDGCTNMVVNGNEYAGIFPVWNWARIPGVTAPQLKEIPKAKSSWQTPGTSTFAGGVSDSLYGVTAYSYNDTYSDINTGANKAWFFFDDEIVCLGAGIQSTSAEPVFTTINQCLLSDKQPIISYNKQQTELSTGTYNYSSPEWALHNQIGYVFPQGGDILVSNQFQTGNWYDINNTASKDMKQEAVFTIGVDHGKKPNNASYAYIVVPNKQTVKELNTYIKKNNIEILANTPQLQVVRHKGLDILQMVFYQAGEFRHKDITVKVDKGCALMLKNIHRKEASLHIADPKQALSEIKINIRIPKKLKEEKELICNFGDNSIYAGKSQVYPLGF